MKKINLYIYPQLVYSHQTLILKLAIASMAFTPVKKDSVYICTGKYATVYHTNQYCKGLKGCKSAVVKVSLKDAITKDGRRACKECSK